MPVCMQSKSSLSRGSCLSTCSQCEVLEDSEPAYHCSHCGRPVMPSASGCSNMLPCTQCLQSGAQQTPSPRMLHTLAHTVACCLIVLASLPMLLAVFTAAHMKPGTQQLPIAHVAHYMNSTRHAAHRHTQTHACMYANATVPDSEQPQTSVTPVYPSFYVNFTHMPAATPVGCVSVMPLCLTFYVYFTHGCGSIAEGSCLLRAWSGCSVITGFYSNPRVLVQSKGDIAARCPGTGSTWHKSCLTLHTHACTLFVAASLFWL
jgi:predicted nucleic acid-binding Zn ribbon protein